MTKQRCRGEEEMGDLFIEYHDNQWGKPTFDDQIMFEFLVLESFQAGLSWSTILQKREAFREAFDGFDVQKVAKYDETKLKALLENKEIIRNESKLKAAINNAKQFIDVQEECGSFSQFMWEYVDHTPVDNEVKNRRMMKGEDDLSAQIAKDLKKKGFKFVGPTIVYSFMEAMGLINNHEVTCFRYPEVKKVKIETA